VHGTDVADDALTTLFEAQRDTALGWRTSTAQERVARIKRLLATLRGYRAELLRAASADFGRPATEVSLTELVSITREAKLAIRKTARWMRPRYRAPTLVGFGTRAVIRPEPRGRALIISPWNYPYTLTFGPLISALAAGCPVIIKPSELTPHHSETIAKIAREAFLPQEVAVVEGDAAVAAALCELPFDHIFFTGSTAIGRRVMAAAARNLSSVSLELGGKSPVIVDSSADLDQAARVIMAAKFVNNGQTCIAPDHLYVEESVRQAFLERCVAWIHNTYGASDSQQKAAPDLARVVSDRHAQRLAALLKEAVDAGARVVTGGSVDCAARFIAPTLLVNVPPGVALMQEEIFGPILPIISYNSLDAVLGTIGSAPKPLALYVWTRRKDVADRVVATTSSGGVCINHCLIQFAHGNVPFGGVNASGIGSAHGPWGFAAFSHERAVVTSRVMIADKLLPPYTRLKQRLIRWLER
jgi:aldehyde dehydrogenase (NAD+)